MEETITISQTTPSIDVASQRAMNIAVRKLEELKDYADANSISRIDSLCFVGFCMEPETYKTHASYEYDFRVVFK